MFDVARKLTVFEIDKGMAQSRRDFVLTDENFRVRAAQVARTGVNVLICGAVSKPLELAVSAMGIDVIPQTCGSVDDVLLAFVDGRLLNDGFLMPGCCGRRFRGRRNGRGHGGRRRSG